MRIKILIALLLFGVAASAQYIKPNNAYGVIENRRVEDSTLFYPTGCGSPSLRSVNMLHGAIYMDSCNHRVWIFDPAGAGQWDSLHLGISGGGGGPFYDSVLMCSVNRLIDSLTAVRTTIDSGLMPPGNDQDIFFNDAGVRNAVDGLAFNKTFREICLGCDISIGDAAINGGGAMHGRLTVSPQNGSSTIGGDSVDLKSTAGTNHAVRVITNNTERIVVTNAGDIIIPTPIVTDTVNNKPVTINISTNKLGHLDHYPGGGIPAVKTINGSSILGVGDLTAFPAEVPLGNIFVKGSFNAADIYDLSAQGDNTFALNGNALRITGSSGGFNGYIRIPVYGGASGLQRWTVSDSFKIISHSYGVQTGTHCYNPGRANDVVGFINMNSSPANLTIYKSAGASGTRLDGGTPPTLAFSDGDVITSTTDYNLYDSTITLTVKNTTTNTTATPISYSMSAGDIINTHWFCFGSVGGTYDLYSITISSQEYKNALVANVCDSKRSGAIAGSFARGVSEQLGTIFHHSIIYGGQGDLFENTVANLGLLRALNPYQIYEGSMGRNDLATGTTPLQVLGFSDILYNAFVPNGTNVLFGNFAEASTSGQAQHIKTVDSLQKAKYPTHYVDLFDSTVSADGINARPALIASDSIHPAGPGHDKWLNTDTLSHKLINLTARSAQIQGGDNQSLGVIGNRIAPINTKEFKTFEVVNDTMLMRRYKDGSYDLLPMRGKGTAISTLDQLLSSTGSSPLTANYTVDLGGFAWTIGNGSGGNIQLPFTVPNAADARLLGYITLCWLRVFSGSYLAKTGFYCCDVSSFGNSDANIPVNIQPVGANDSSHMIGVYQSFANGNHGVLGSIRGDGSAAITKLFLNKGANGGAYETGGAASAIFEASTTNQGILVPRLTTAQMNAIISPATWLMVFNIDSVSFCTYNGAAWIKIGGPGGSVGKDTLQVFNVGSVSALPLSSTNNKDSVRIYKLLADNGLSDSSAADSTIHVMLGGPLTKTDTITLGTHDLIYASLSTGQFKVKGSQIGNSGSGYNIMVKNPDSALAQVSISTFLTDALLTSGVYTPTLTGGSNSASTTAQPCHWSRNGNQITVTGVLTATATLTATSTVIDISLPVASGMAATTDLSGLMSSSAIAGLAGGIEGNLSSDIARLTYVAVGTGSDKLFFHFVYTYSAP